MKNLHVSMKDDLNDDKSLNKNFKNAKNKNEKF